MAVLDKGVPIPKSTCGRKRIYPFYDMEVDDSCFLPNKKAADFSTIIFNMKPKKFVRRTVTEDGVLWVRVWRKL